LVLCTGSAEKRPMGLEFSGIRRVEYLLLK
jgi:hypothetical protein